ncbi:hypothetical protein HY251_06325 [bacterium]|nr:hypothetical protein [bacterium]
MRRSVAVLALPLASSLVVLGARVQADDTKEAKVDLKKRAALAVGAKTLEERETTLKKTMTYSPQGKMPQAVILELSSAYKAVREAQEVQGDRVSKETVRFESWKKSGKGGKKDFDDTTLSGRVVHIPGTTEASPDFSIEGDDGKATGPAQPDPTDLTAVAPPTKIAKDWLTQDFVNAQWKAELETCFPKEPVAVGSEWALDLKEVATTLYPTMESDLQRSSGKGKLTSVTTEDGIKVAHIEVHIAIQLTKVPETQYAPADDGTKDNGLMKRTAVIDLSLEPEKKAFLSARLDEVLDISFEAKDKAGAVTGVEAKIEKAIKLSEGPAPKK